MGSDVIGDIPSAGPGKFSTCHCSCLSLLSCQHQWGFLPTIGDGGVKKRETLVCPIRILITTTITTITIMAR
jgi:hypothetical protein